MIATFVNTFESLDPRLALLALAFHLANFGFRAVAWRNVLRPAYPDREVPLFGIAGAYAAGVAANSFMPARGGDLVKIGLARSRIRGSSVATIAASMAVISSLDALIGVLAIVVLGAFGLLPSPPGLPTLPAAPGLFAGHVAILGALGLAVVVAVFVVRRRLAARLAMLWTGVKRGLSVLTQPRRYATEVVPFQLAAWASRVGAAFFLLAAFDVPATLAAAVIVVVVGGLSTLVPTPGGVGTQQVFLAYVLHTTASTAAIVSFSVGMQAAITSLNLLLGLTAAMIMFRTFRPVAAMRALR